MPLSQPALEVRLTAASGDEGLRRGAELRGLITVLVELGLGDLEGVVPRLEGLPPSPGLAAVLETGARTWTLSLGVTAPEPLELSAQLCDPEGTCADLTGQAASDAPQLAVAELLLGVAAALERPPSDDVVAGWRRAVSKDPYAILLAGRAAATWYGILPAAEGALVGNNRRDPVDRAVLVDPMIAGSAWVLSRRDAARGEHGRARIPLTRARASRPATTLLVADDAALLDTVTTNPRLALAAWDEVGRAAPHDLRWVLPRAAAALRANQVDRAAQLLDALPEEAQEAQPVVALRVGIADAADPAGARDTLLERWQRAAPTDPEPVRRRIALRVASRAYADALALTAELAVRGRAEEAAQLALPLAIGAGDSAAAVRAAQSLGLVDVAAQIEASVRLEADPTAYDAVPPSAPVARATALLRAGKPSESLAVADAVLAAERWNPDALAIRAQALEELGREDATVAARRLAWVDPAHPWLADRDR